MYFRLPVVRFEKLKANICVHSKHRIKCDITARSPARSRSSLHNTKPENFRELHLNNAVTVDGTESGLIEYDTPFIHIPEI